MNEALEFLRQFETWQLALGGFAAVSVLISAGTVVVLWATSRGREDAPEEPEMPATAEVLRPEFRPRAPRQPGDEDPAHLLSMMRHALATRKVNLLERYGERLRAVGWVRLPATVGECDDMIRELARAETESR